MVDLPSRATGPESSAAVSYTDEDDAGPTLSIGVICVPAFRGSPWRGSGLVARRGRAQASDGNCPEATAADRGLEKFFGRSTEIPCTDPSWSTSDMLVGSVGDRAQIRELCRLDGKVSSPIVSLAGDLKSRIAWERRSGWRLGFKYIAEWSKGSAGSGGEEQRVGVSSVMG